MVGAGILLRLNHNMAENGRNIRPFVQTVANRPLHSSPSGSMVSVMAMFRQLTPLEFYNAGGGRSALDLILGFPD